MVKVEAHRENDGLFVCKNMHKTGLFEGIEKRLKMLENFSQKLLTKQNSCDIITKLSQKQQQMFFDK